MAGSEVGLRGGGGRTKMESVSGRAAYCYNCFSERSALPRLVFVCDLRMKEDCETRYKGQLGGFCQAQL